MKRSRSKLSDSTDILQSLFESGSSGLSYQFIRWKLVNNWRDIVGDSLARNTEPVGIRNGTLFLWVKTSSWMHQVLFVREHIVLKINKYLEKDVIKKIYFSSQRHELSEKLSGTLKGFIKNIESR